MSKKHQPPQAAPVEHALKTLADYEAAKARMYELAHSPFPEGSSEHSIEQQLEYFRLDADCKHFDARRAELEYIGRLSSSGYAGINKQGTIVDRRVHKDAIPIPANRMFNVPQPKKL